MTIDVLEKVNRLPLEKQQQIEEFINEVISKTDASIHDEISVSELRKKNMGWAKGKIWIADDFNDTPEEFKEYM
jgi:hypothetical protein